MKSIGSFTPFLLLLFKLSTAEAPLFVHFWVVWNVGQGQWVTAVNQNSCRHFDFGGEVFSLKKNLPLFRQLCRDKSNILYLSHADWDHYAFFDSLLRNSTRVCWAARPIEKLKKMDHDVTFCGVQQTPAVPPTFSNKKDFSVQILHLKAKDPHRNNTSSVVRYNDFLLPGDSPTAEEKAWIQNLPLINHIRILILGHHGSKTSTSDLLLHHLPHLKMAIASARAKKYGHPHADVRKRLKQFKIPLIKTEDWGTLLIIN